MIPEIDEIINAVIDREGDGKGKAQQDDRGGATRWGVTQATAIIAGYKKPVSELTRDEAFAILLHKYVMQPGFDLVANINVPIAAELVDAGVLSGPHRPIAWLQRILNCFNGKESYWPDITDDGVIGPSTLSALGSYLAKRGAEGERVMIAALNALQGAFLIMIAEKDLSQETNVYGWIARRVAQ